MIIRKGDRLVLAMPGDWLTQDRADHVKASIREAIPELDGVTILTGVSGMAVVRDDRTPDRCPTCNEARQLMAGELDPEDELPCIDRWHGSSHNGHYDVPAETELEKQDRLWAETDARWSDPSYTGKDEKCICVFREPGLAPNPRCRAAHSPAYGADETRYGATGHPIDPVVCKNGLGDPCGPQDCVLEHSRPLVDGAGRIGAWKGGALVALRKVLAEVDAHEVATARGGAPYAETVEMLRRVATEMGLEL